MNKEDLKQMGIDFIGLFMIVVFVISMWVVLP